MRMLKEEAPVPATGLLGGHGPAALTACMHQVVELCVELLTGNEQRSKNKREKTAAL